MESSHSNLQFTTFAHQIQKMAEAESNHVGLIVEKARLVSEETTRETQLQKQSAIIDLEKLHLYGIQVLELEQKWARHSIYRVPNQIRKLNPEAYEPKLVSIGPYHYGKPHLQATEEHKHRALQMFLGRTKQTIEGCLEALREVADELRDSYAQLEEEWVQNEDRFLQLMLLDASFIYEIHYLQNTGHDLGYADNDPVFSKSGLLHAGLHLQDDLLMLENQLPYPALNSIAPITTPVQDYMHILDIQRKALIGNLDEKWSPLNEGMPVLRTLSDYYNKAGLTITWCGSYNLADLSFDYNKGILKLPTLRLDNSSECEFLNFLAFERLHPNAGYHISSYIILLRELVQSTEDVALLRSRRILITNHYSSNEVILEVIVKLFRNMSFIPDPLFLPVQTLSQLEKFYGKQMKAWNRRLRAWRWTLKENYFKNPWTLISLVAAFVLLALTICQTVYAVLPFYKPSK